MKGHPVGYYLWWRRLALMAVSLLSLIALGGARADEAQPREGHFVAPDANTGAALQAQAAAASLTPGFNQTSEFMLGSVAVGLILPESDGTIDPNLTDWTVEQRARVLDEVTQGLEWWSQLAPPARLSFVIDDHATTPVTTGYEPITHPYVDEGLWIGETLARLGYASGSHFLRVRTYLNDLRETYHTDWAFAIFVVNSLGDADAAFDDGYFAYAYVGGPFMAMTYDNAGYGIGHMDAVTAHETGHIFRALDQYAGANIPCAAQSGYLGVETQNSQSAGCASNVASIMRGGVYPYDINAIDPYARGQIGWRDSDGDGIFDPVDTTPTLSLTATAQSGNVWSYRGQATDSAYPSTLRPLTTINRVWVEYSVGGGAWAPARPADGEFNSYDEAFMLDLELTASGNHQVALRARNSVGNVSNTAEFIAVVPDPVDGGLDTWLEPLASQAPGPGMPARVSGTATSFEADGTPGAAIARVEYRVDGGAWLTAQAQDGAFDSEAETFSVSPRLPGGTHLLEARAIDATGKVEQKTASVQLTGSYQVFVPVVQR